MNHDMNTKGESWVELWMILLPLVVFINVPGLDTVVKLNETGTPSDQPHQACRLFAGVPSLVKTIQTRTGRLTSLFQ